MAKASDKADKTVGAKSDLKSEKLQAIKVAMEQIDKQFGTGSIMKLGASHHMDIKKYPNLRYGTRSSPRYGGFPCGRITEIYGPGIG
jgi:recombination protein RecA